MASDAGSGDNLVWVSDICVKQRNSDCNTKRVFQGALRLAPDTATANESTRLLHKILKRAGLKS